MPLIRGPLRPAVGLRQPVVTLESLLESIEAGEGQALYLVSGDRVVAEPAAVRLGEALSRLGGCRCEVYRRPAEIAPLLADLRTFSLFESAKIVVAVETAVLADRRAAQGLLQEALEALPLSGEGELMPQERLSASRLLQVLHLFELDPFSSTASELMGQLPDWIFQKQGARGGRRPGKGKLEEMRQELATLLNRGLENGLRGGTEGDLVELAAILEGGLPTGHALVLAESVVAEDHPLVEALQRRGAFLGLARVEAGRGGAWQGLEPLIRELEEQTGVAMARDALAELVRRTLQRQRGRGQQGADADSTARLAGEYRKLAGMTDGGRIERQLVEEVVEDRGEEDVWEVLNAIGRGDGAGALERFRRLLAGADDPLATRLSFFALLADFSRHLLLVGGRLRQGGVPAGEGDYGRFKSRIAPALQEELPGGLENPLAKLHPYRLHRAYLAASRLGETDLSGLPWELLQTELRLKGESGEPDAALAALIAFLSGPPG